jgi:hypothetical protein
MFPPLIKARRIDPSMNAHLADLVKCVAKLHEARLKACHYIKEFHLR